ncbi:MAG: TlpA family protein disulfide reductase [Actinomycetota bacterium]
MINGSRAATRFISLVLLVVLHMAGCTNSNDTSSTDGESHGGAGDLPGPLPSDVAFRKPPRSAVAAPDFSADLLDGTPVTASDLWDDRPLVLMFTASWCDRCADVHRAVAGVVDEHEGAIGLLGVVPADDAEGARGYAQDLQLGHPIAVGDESVWLNYAADEPPLVALIAPGGKILRGWPGGVHAADLAGHLEKLFEPSTAEGG